jgi:hypothetical protein
MTVKDLVEYFPQDVIIRFSDFNKEMTLQEALADAELGEYEVELVRPLALNKILIMVCI